MWKLKLKARFHNKQGAEPAHVRLTVEPRAFGKNPVIILAVRIWCGRERWKKNVGDPFLTTRSGRFHSGYLVWFLKQGLRPRLASSSIFSQGWPGPVGPLLLPPPKYKITGLDHHTLLKSSALLLFCFWDNVSNYSLGCFENHSVAKAGLMQSPEWNYSCEPPHLVILIVFKSPFSAALIAFIWICAFF